MTERHRLIADPIARYIRTQGTREPAPCIALREETLADDDRRAHYQLGPEEIQLLTLLVELLGARLIIEIGTFRGYATLVLALAIGPEGRVITIDADAGVQSEGRRHWRTAGVDGRIEPHTGDARSVMARLVADPAVSGAVDLVLIDADKEAYPIYYEQALSVLRPGGVVVLDNTLWRGRVTDPREQGFRTRAVRALNAGIGADERVTPMLLPLGDGVTVARKRGQTERRSSEAFRGPSRGTER